LKKAANDPWIGRDWFALKEQIGIDFAGEPLLRLTKCVVHDVSENLMCEKTLAFDGLRASGKTAGTKICGVGAGP
jgi:FecR protein